ncbi:MAG: hypothetical protein M1825_000339 [Sarcosagium campestre]|nr:MAG: hypothetical protein M1825_000339 [Sarcosagium campestre]
MYIRSLLGTIGSAILPFVRSVPSSRDALSDSPPVPPAVFAELEEHARIVDISYCVGMTGVHSPFTCASRCDEFSNFELVTTWNTGPLLSDSCGYIALSHSSNGRGRIIVAFRGTYSIANTIVDLSTIPQVYEPYPGDDDDDGNDSDRKDPPPAACLNCTVHSGFHRAWTHTRSEVMPHLSSLNTLYPDYKMTLVGHSLGGAVALLAGLEAHYRGWSPHVTTFGEPRVGNGALTAYVDERFDGVGDEIHNMHMHQQQQQPQPITRSTYYRVTHIGDPVPLLPLQEWGYRMHGAELHIRRLGLPPTETDVVVCKGAEDPRCIAGDGERPDDGSSWKDGDTDEKAKDGNDIEPRWWGEDGGMWAVPPRFQIWELFFAHRDYFWRLGLCVPGGDPGRWRWGQSEEL